MCVLRKVASTQQTQSSKKTPMTTTIRELCSGLVEFGSIPGSNAPFTPTGYVWIIEVTFLAWLFLNVWLTTIPIKPFILGRQKSDGDMWLALGAGVLFVLIGIFMCHWFTVRITSDLTRWNILISGLAYLYRSVQIWWYRNHQQTYDHHHGHYRQYTYALEAREPRDKTVIRESSSRPDHAAS